MTLDECQLNIVTYQGPGYDPNWISCYLENDQCFCFHPNQGQGNISGETKQLELPKELPKTGPSIELSLILILITTYVIIKYGSKYVFLAKQSKNKTGR